MIIKTKIENRGGAMRTTYYKYMGTNGKPTCGPKNQAAAFSPEMAAKVLEQLKTIDHRFVDAELVDG